MDVKLGWYSGESTSLGQCSVPSWSRLRFSYPLHLNQSWSEKLNFLMTLSFEFVKETIKEPRIMSFKLQTSLKVRPFLGIADLVRVLKRDASAFGKQANNNSKIIILLKTILVKQLWLNLHDANMNVKWTNFVSRFSPQQRLKDIKKLIWLQQEWRKPLFFVVSCFSNSLQVVNSFLFSWPF